MADALNLDLLVKKTRLIPWYYVIFLSLAENSGV